MNLYACKDCNNGIRFYKKKIDDTQYEFAARCHCDLGKKWYYEQKSDYGKGYYIPAYSEVMHTQDDCPF